MTASRVLRVCNEYYEQRPPSYKRGGEGVRERGRRGRRIG
jgi:hypothetical protein